jgi:uncharacterized protein (DUF2147 family)
MPDTSARCNAVSHLQEIAMKLVPVLAASLLAAPLALAQAPNQPLGRWITESGNLEVDIAPCASGLCGTVVRVLGNRSMSGPGQEMQAADARPALGMVILSELQPAGEGGELAGTIYNRENGKNYSVKLATDAAGQMLVRAYVGLPLFGKTQVWRRPAGGAQ